MASLLWGRVYYKDVFSGNLREKPGGRMSLAIGGTSHLEIGSLKPKNIKKLCEEFALSTPAVNMLIKSLTHYKEAAKQAILESDFGSMSFKNKLINLMEARWNGTFALIGKS